MWKIRKINKRENKEIRERKQMIHMGAASVWESICLLMKD